MFTASTTVPQPVIYVKERTSVCARLVSFLLMLISSCVLVSMLLSMAVYMTATPETLAQLTGNPEVIVRTLNCDVRTLNHELEIENPTVEIVVPEVEVCSGLIDTKDVEMTLQVLDAPKVDFPVTSIMDVDDFDITSNVDVAASAQTEVAAAASLSPNPTLRRASRIFIYAILAVKLLSVLYFVGLVAYRYYTSHDVMEQLMQFKANSMSYLSAVASEISAGVSSLYAKLISFDFAGIWQQVANFAGQVWAATVETVSNVVSLITKRNVETVKVLDA